MILVLSGQEPAAILVAAYPEEALVLINRAFAGRGGTDLIELQAQTITITASAPDHESVTIETELFENELTTVNLRLPPIRFVDVEISGDRSGRVYHGALYVGTAPLTLRLPMDQFEFIELETDDERRGTVVFQTPMRGDVLTGVSLRTQVPLPSGTVERERRHFYWAWGATWLSGIATWISYYTFVETAGALNHQFSDGLYNRYQLTRYISTGAFIALGTAAVYTIFRGVRYFRIANRQSTPVTVPSARGN